MAGFKYDEAELVRCARDGNSNAYGELVMAHQQFVYNIALRAVGNPQEAQDLSQEVFLRAWQGIPGFRGQSMFRTWLYRITMNLCYNRRPQLHRELANLPLDEVHEIPADPHASIAAGLEAREQRAFIQAKIKELPPSYRILVQLRYQQDLAYEEIAEILSMPLGTVKTGLYRARALLAGALRSYMEVNNG